MLKAKKYFLTPAPAHAPAYTPAPFPVPCPAFCQAWTCEFSDLIHSGLHPRGPLVCGQGHEHCQGVALSMQDWRLLMRQGVARIGGV